MNEVIHISNFDVFGDYTVERVPNSITNIMNGDIFTNGYMVIIDHNTGEGIEVELKSNEARRSPLGFNDLIESLMLEDKNKRFKIKEVLYHLKSIDKEFTVYSRGCATPESTIAALKLIKNEEDMINNERRSKNN